MSNKIKTSYVSDPATGLRIGTIRLGHKKIETPIKALQPSKFKPNIHLNSKIKGLNEIYRTFPSVNLHAKKSGRITKYAIESYRRPGGKRDELNGQFQRQLNKVSRDEITICFTGYEGDSYPSSEELRFLANRSQYYSSDILPLPVFPQITKYVDLDSLPEYLSFLDTVVIEEYKKLNYMPLMGIVPIKLGPLIVEEIVKVLINNDISAFCVDFGGSTITSKYPDVIDFYKSLLDYGLLESSLIYSINASGGRTAHRKQVVEAKDIISFGYGFDVLGRPQAAPIPSKVRESMVLSVDQKLRLFNKSDYGYYKVIGSDIKKVYPEDSSIRLEDLFNVQVRRPESGAAYLDTSLSSLFNMEQQGLEALHLRQVVHDSKTEKYMSDKEHLDERDRKQIFAIPKEIRSK